MGLTLAQKIIENHLVSGKMEPGKEIALKDRPDVDRGRHRDHGISPVRGLGTGPGKNQTFRKLC